MEAADGLCPRPKPPCHKPVQPRKIFPERIQTHSLIACVHIANRGTELADVTGEILETQYLPEPHSVTGAGLLNPVSNRVIKLSPSSMGRGRANSSGVRLRRRLTAARLMERGRALRSSFVGCGGAAGTVGSGGAVDTVGSGGAVDTVGGVAAVGTGVEADCGMKCAISLMMRR